MNAFLFRLGSINAASSVIISAIGGHKPWEADRKFTFSTSFNLHMSSSIGMMFCSYKTTYTALFTGLLFMIGSGLFCGAATYRCFYDDKKYNYLMPPGGSMIISAWTLLAFC